MLSSLGPTLGDVIGMLPASNINTGRFLASVPLQNVIKFDKKKIFRCNMWVFWLTIVEMICQYIHQFKMSASRVTDKEIENFTFTVIQSEPFLQNNCIRIHIGKHEAEITKTITKKKKRYLLFSWLSLRQLYPLKLKIKTNDLIYSYDKEFAFSVWFH